eukprot:gene33084-biopygen21399
MALSRQSWWPWVRRAAVWGFFALIAWLLVRQARTIDWDDVLDAIRALPATTLLAAGLSIRLAITCTASGFCAWSSAARIAVGVQEEQVNPVQLHGGQAGLQRGRQARLDLFCGRRGQIVLGGDLHPARQAAAKSLANQGFATAVDRCGVQHGDSCVDGRHHRGLRLVAVGLAPDLANAAAAKRQATDLANGTQSRRLHGYRGEKCACNLCGGTAATVVCRYDRRLKPLTTVSCDGCGLMRTDPMPSEDEQLRGGDALQRMPPCEQPGVMLLNPPYGERIAAAGTAGRNASERAADRAQGRAVGREEAQTEDGGEFFSRCNSSSSAWRAG